MYKSSFIFLLLFYVLIFHKSCQEPIKCCLKLKYSCTILMSSVFTRKGLSSNYVIVVCSGSMASQAFWGSKLQQIENCIWFFFYFIKLARPNPSSFDINWIYRPPGTSQQETGGGKVLIKKEDGCIRPARSPHSGCQSNKYL